MNEWMNNEWMNELINELINAWMNKWTNEQMNEWTNEWMNESLGWYSDEWLDDCNYARHYVQYTATLPRHYAALFVQFYTGLGVCL